MTKLSTLDKFLLSNTGVNLLDGSNWGFCSIEDYTKLNEDCKGNIDKRFVEFYVLKASSGVLVSVNSMYMFNLLRKLSNVEIDSEDMDEANTSNMKGSLDFRNFLANNKNYQGFIGVNETTDATNVSISKVLYPSFKVDLKEVMLRFKDLDVQYLDENNKWNQYNKTLTEEEFAKSFSISPTRNCMVLPIRLGQGFE